MEEKCLFKRKTLRNQWKFSTDCSKDIIDTEDHITGECYLHDATPWDEATLEQVVISKNNWLCSPEKQFWTSLEEDILDSLMDCTYYKVTCIIMRGT